MPQQAKLNEDDFPNESPADRNDQLSTLLNRNGITFGTVPSYPHATIQYDQEVTQTLDSFAQLTARRNVIEPQLWNFLVSLTNTPSWGSYTKSRTEWLSTISLCTAEPRDYSF
jgi:hypothetical protein